MRLMNKPLETVLGLDVGAKRTGVARVHLQAKLPEPLGVIAMERDYIAQLQEYIDEHDPDALVIGLPLNMLSEDTSQTKFTRGIVKEIKSAISLPIFLIDEVGSSKEADARQQTGVARDATAAAVLLEDFTAANERGEVQRV